MIGMGRYGRRVAEQLRSDGHALLVVELDPAKLEHADKGALPIAYGDACDAEFLATLPLEQVKWLVCTVRDPAQQRLMVSALRQHSIDCRLAVAASDDQAAEWLADQGVDIIMRPYADAAEIALAQLRAVFEQESFGQTQRKEWGHAYA